MTKIHFIALLIIGSLLLFGCFQPKEKMTFGSSINGTNFQVHYAGNISSIAVVCPFPTIDNIVPYPQDAKHGILRVQNLNTTHTKNYSIKLNASLPTGVSAYSRCDRFSLYNGTWHNANSSYTCLTGVSSNNTSAYIWMKFNCSNVTFAPNTTSTSINFTLNITEID